MNNNVVTFDNSNLNLKVRAILNTDGSISINAEDTAIGFGWTEQKNNKEYIRWRTINGYLNELGFSQVVAKDDYIPESLFYMLGMKANNGVALEFQKWLAIEVLPSIRKTGTYSSNSANNGSKKELSAKETIEIVGVVADILKTDKAGKTLMLETMLEELGISTKFLPSYVDEEYRETKSATDLLKQIGASIGVRAFNVLLLDKGYLEEHTRTSSKGLQKTYKQLSDKGLEYGKNAITSKNQKEPQPLYYVDTFKELYSKVTREDDEEES